MHLDALSPDFNYHFISKCGHPLPIPLRLSVKFADAFLLEGGRVYGEEVVVTDMLMSGDLLLDDLEDIRIEWPISEATLQIIFAHKNFVGCSITSRVSTYLSSKLNPPGRRPDEYCHAPAMALSPSMCGGYTLDRRHVVTKRLSITHPATCKRNSPQGKETGDVKDSRQMLQAAGMIYKSGSIIHPDPDPVYSLRGTGKKRAKKRSTKQADACGRKSRAVRVSGCVAVHGQLVQSSNRSG
ncbi:hypothetical protein B0H13DRAFT_1905398 [Mycena leptocephala]|nr:hypothetical protein B0H13DRAFT_1905398 [Mycena leptocephala]